MSEDTSCPIWNTPATVISKDYGFRLTYDSPRAGGRFLCVGNMRDWPIGLNDSDKAKLTTWILEQNRVGEIALVDADRRSNIQTAVRLSPAARCDRFLQFLALEEKHLGATVRFADDKPECSNALLSALAWGECMNLEELQFMARSLEGRGLIEWRLTSSAMYATLTLTGYARLAEIEITNQNSSQAFVAMWFDSSTQPIFDEGIEVAIRSAGFKPLRIDRKETIQKVDDEIVAEIRRSRFLVADFTSDPGKPRGGVYFEAGLAMGLNIPVLWMCRKDLIDQVHFDTRQFSHIVWEGPEDVKSKLTNRIRAVIGQGPLTH